MHYLSYLLGSMILQSVGGYFLPFFWGIGFVHLFPCLSGIIAYRFMTLNSTEKYHFYFYLSCSPFLGIFATLIALLLEFMTQDNEPTFAADFQNNILDTVHLTAVQKVKLQFIDNPWIEDNDQELETYIDIMESPNRTLKQNAIEKSIMSPSKASVMLLRKGLNDQDKDIQYFSASGFMVLNDVFQKKINTLTKTLHEHPEHYFQLGIVYDQFCFWEVPSLEQKKIFRKQAERCYLNYLSQFPESEECTSALGRLYIHQKRFVDVVKLLNDFLTVFPDSMTIRPWLAEALYASKQYSLLKHFTKESLLNHDIPEVLVDGFNYWAFASDIVFYEDQNERRDVACDISANEE